MLNELKEMFKELKQIWKDGWNEIKAIWIYEWHQVKKDRLARQAKRVIVELKKDPYL